MFDENVWPQARCVTKVIVFFGEIVLLSNRSFSSMVWVLLMSSFGSRARCVAKLRAPCICMHVFFDERGWLPSSLYRGAT